VASRYWRVDGLQGADFLRLDASTHRYARHSHEGYALGVVDAGAHAFAARGRVWTAIPGRVIIVNPEEAHDGGPASRDHAYSYRMIYLDRALVTAAIDEAAGRHSATTYFAEPVVADPALSAWIREAHRAFEQPESRIECETRLLTAVIELARRHARAPTKTEAGNRNAREVGLALEYLREHLAENCSLAELAAVAGVDRFRLLRSFRRATGLPPHRYQTQVRLRRAKILMAKGETVARTAAIVGFADQSHLIRQFKSTYGVTPGAYLGRRVQ
jgi:AraC-like DNA-binding protein